MPKGILADDFRVQTYRGQPVLTWWEGKTTPRGYGQGTWVIADTSYREIARVKAVGDVGGDLHDIELTDAGTALIPIYKIVPQDLTPIGAYADGEAIDSLIQEIDLETGELVWEWSSLEHVGLTESLAGIPQKTASRTTTSTSTRSTSTATATCSSPPATPGRSTSSTARPAR